MKKPSMESIYLQSPDVVARSIEDEIIIVPLTSGIGKDPDDLFTLNETGREIWKRLDGKKNLQQVMQALSKEYDDPDQGMETDILGLVAELLKRKLIVENK